MAPPRKSRIHTAAISRCSQSDSEIGDYLLNQKVPHAKGYAGYTIMCPKYSIRGVQKKIFINHDTGNFFCLKCSKKGSWDQLQKHFDDTKRAVLRKTPSKCFPEIMLPNMDSTGSHYLSEILDTSQPLPIDEDELDTLMGMYGGLGLRAPALQSYGVRRSYNDHLLMPFYHPVSQAVVGVKVISMDTESTDRKTSSYGKPNALCLGTCNLFILDKMSARNKSLVITSSEFDAIAVFQETKKPSIALPDPNYIFSDEILQMLEQFDQIIFWMDKSVVTKQHLKSLQNQLKSNRCFTLSDPVLSEQTPMSAMHCGANLKKILQNPVCLHNAAVVNFEFFRESVQQAIENNHILTGIPWMRFRKLTHILGGHRRGEMTVLTGKTGVGKTTFASEYALDLCEQGVPTLWGSFEIPNARLCSTMIQQFARRSLLEGKEKFDYWADLFAGLPMHFMLYHSSQDVEEVIKTMYFAVETLKVSHIIIDNLQFMVGMQGSMEQWGKQDLTVGAFRKFASTTNCHITLIAHPKKCDKLLSINSIMGGAKITQEADNVLGVQCKGHGKYIEVWKNRYSGTLGEVPLHFNPQCYTMSAPASLADLPGVQLRRDSPAV